MVVDLVRLLEDFREEIRDELRLQRKILTSLLDAIEEARGSITDDAEIGDESITCPDCGESREDKIEETGTMGDPSRTTCLTCGVSFSSRGEG